MFPYEDIFVHEFTHGILNMGIERMRGGGEFRARLESAYRNALNEGLWERTYAGDNPDEYWAEGVQAWFGLNDPPGPIHNNINTRAELESYDPVLAGLIHEIFGDAEVISSCHGTWDINHDFIIEGVIKNHDGQPMVNVDLWAWQGSRLKSGSDRTDQKGVFKIRVPDGSFRLDIYAGSPRGCAGYYDGKGGLATSRTGADLVIVDGANVTRIRVKFPEQVADLPIKPGGCKA